MCLQIKIKSACMNKNEKKSTSIIVIYTDTDECVYLYLCLYIELKCALHSSLVFD